MSIAIIDCDSLVFTIIHPNKQLDENGNPMRTEDDKRFLYVEKTQEEIIKCADDLMESVLTKGEFSHYIGFIKGANTIKSRKDVNPEYKSNRNKEQPKWWPFTKDYLISNWGVIPVDNIEVDDAVNITRLNIKDSHIVAIDKDELNLEGCHYNWSRNEWCIMSKDDALYSFWKDMITGQSGDNIKGCPGIGKANEIFTKHLFKPTPMYVLELYIKVFKDEQLAITEFNKNYQCLKILDKYKGFVIPEAIEFKRKDVNKKITEEWE